jgi:hypothetical protein
MDAMPLEQPEARRRLAARLPSVDASVIWIAICVALPAVAMFAARLESIDLAYQVRIGDLMLRTHRLPSVDTLTFTVSGRRWVDQQWLAQLVFALVHRAGGWPAISLVRVGVVGATLAFVFLACRAAGAGRRPAALLTCGAFGASALGLTVRPQLFGFLAFAFTVWVVTGRDRHPGRLWSLPPLVAVWANVHGSFFFPPLLLGLAWLEDRRRPDARRLLVLAGACLAASLLNPFGVGVWGYVATIGTNPTIQHSIVEWSPPSIRSIPGGIFFLTVIGTIGVLARHERPIPWPRLLTLGIFLVLALQSGRATMWWTLILAPVLVSLAPADRSPSASRASAGMAVLVGVTIVAVAVVLSPWSRPTAPPGAHLMSDAPPGITAALERYAPPGSRILAAQRWGSWLEWSMPGRPVFVDSRIELYPAGVWQQYLDVSAAVEGWRSILDRWDVDVVAVSATQQRPLIPHLRDDPAWRQVYADEDGAVFVRS